MVMNHESVDLCSARHKKKKTKEVEVGGKGKALQGRLL